MPIACISCGSENSDNALMGDGNSKCRACGSYLVTANKNIVRPIATPVSDKEVVNAPPKDFIEILFEKCKIVGLAVIVLEAINIFSFGMIPGMITAVFAQQAFLQFKGHDPLYGDGSMLIMFFINLLWLPSILIAWAVMQSLRIRYKTSYLYLLPLTLIPASWFLSVCFFADIMFVHR